MMVMVGKKGKARQGKKLKMIKYLFFRRIQTEAKDYVLNTLNVIFCDLDRWIEIKK